MVRSAPTAIAIACALLVPALRSLGQGPAPAGGSAAPAQPALSTVTPSVRVRDIARVETVRGNQLAGYGLVVGLAGTGDSQQSPFTVQSVVNMLQRFGVSVDSRRLKTRNVAAVMVTADVPAFYKNGSKLDVTVSSLGDATSLQGGLLLQTPLLGADETVYAVAQGAVSIGGFSVGGGGASVTKNHPTTGRVPGGALIEKEIATTLAASDGTVRINLTDPDFGNAARVAAAVNARFGTGVARADDPATIRVTPSAAYRDDLVRLVSDLGDVQVQPSAPARVVLNERTGTVVIGGAVRIAPVAVAHGALTVQIQNDLLVSQPGPISPGGQTVVVPDTSATVTEKRTSLVELQGGTTLAELVRALNALKVTPRDVVAIVQAIKQSGALYADLEVQ